MSLYFKQNKLYTLGGMAGSGDAELGNCEVTGMNVYRLVDL